MILFHAYLSCYVHMASSTGTSGKALSTFEQTYATLGASKCSQTCVTGSYIFMDIVNSGKSVDCWCGNTISYVTSSAGVLGIGTVSGEAGENNCYACQGGVMAGSFVSGRRSLV